MRACMHIYIIMYIFIDYYETIAATVYGLTTEDVQDRLRWNRLSLKSEYFTYIRRRGRSKTKTRIQNRECTLLFI